MGYYSHFSLELLRADGQVDHTIEEDVILNDLYASSEYADYCLHGEESGKWYEYREEMQKFSKKYPSILFFIQREGEENGDMERNYFLNGKYQTIKGEMVFASYDPNGFN